MKKLNLFEIAAFVLLLACVLTACPPAEDDPPPPVPASMIFVDNLQNPSKQFAIFENFTFNVKIFTVAPGSIEDISGVNPNDEISGSIRDADDKWDNSFTGEALQMSSSTNEILSAILGSLFSASGIAIDLTYTKVDGNITAVSVDFPGGGMSGAAQAMMGGTYQKVP